MVYTPKLSILGKWWSSTGFRGTRGANPNVGLSISDFGHPGHPERRSSSDTSRSRATPKDPLKVSDHAVAPRIPSRDHCFLCHKWLMDVNKPPNMVTIDFAPSPSSFGRWKSSSQSKMGVFKRRTLRSACGKQALARTLRLAYRTSASAWR